MKSIVKIKFELIIVMALILGTILPAIAVVAVSEIEETEVTEVLEDVPDPHMSNSDPLDNDKSLSDFDSSSKVLDKELIPEEDFEIAIEEEELIGERNANKLELIEMQVRSQADLFIALQSPNLGTIRLMNSFEIDTEIIIDREIRFTIDTLGTTLFFIDEGAMKINQSGRMTVYSDSSNSSIFPQLAVINIVRKTLLDMDSPGIIIDGGELSLSYATGLNMLDTGIEIKNNGSLLVGSAELVVDNRKHPNGVAIRMNGGHINTMYGSASTILYGRKAIVSETGKNSHHFRSRTEAGAINQRRFMLVSDRGNPVYTNLPGAILTVHGDLNAADSNNRPVRSSRMGMWELESDVPAAWDSNEAPVFDSAVRGIIFTVTQEGNAVPTVDSLNNEEFGNLFSKGIFSDYRGLSNRFNSSREPESISISPKNNIIPVGTAQQLIGNLTPDASLLDDPYVFWSSSNDAIATVSSTGKVTGIQPGEVLITGELDNGFSDISRIMVEEFTYDFSEIEGETVAIVTGYLGTNQDISIPAEAAFLVDDTLYFVPVVEIGDLAMKEKGLKSVKIPETIHSIGVSAFENNSIEELALPDSVKYIGSSAFSYNRINNLRLSNNLTNIQSSTFEHNQLEFVEFPESINEIRSGAFRDNKLKNLLVPNAVTVIGNSAFSDNQIMVARLGDGITDMGQRVFSRSPLERIEVSSYKVESYRGILNPLSGISPIFGVTERTYLGISTPSYTAETSLTNNLSVGESLLLGGLSKNKYQLEDLFNFKFSPVSATPEWYKDGVLLEKETGSELIIEHAEELDSGIYHAVIDGVHLSDIYVQVSPLINPDIPPINPEDLNPEPENPNTNEGALGIRYVSSLNFGEIERKKKQQEIFSIPPKNIHGNEYSEMVTVQDMRSENQREGWLLTVSQLDEFMDGAEIIMDPYVHESYSNELGVQVAPDFITLNQSNQVFSWLDNGNSPGIVSLGLTQLADLGVRLRVPSGIGIGSYSTTLEWALSTGP